MTPRTLLTVCIAAWTLAACETYTEQTSPCFGKNGEPVVSRAHHVFVSPTDDETSEVNDCTFEYLPRPE